MDKLLIDVDESNFTAEVEHASRPVLLEFTAQWCAPCRALAPIVHAIAEDHAGRLRVGVVDLDASPGLAARFGVRGAPTLILFAGGREVGRQLGAGTRRRLLGWLAGHGVTDALGAGVM